MKQATNLAGIGSRRSLLAAIAVLAALATALAMFFVVGARPAAAQDNEYIGPQGMEALENAEERGVTAEELTIGEAQAVKNPDSLNFGDVETGASQTQSVTVSVQREGQVCIPVPFIGEQCFGNVAVKINGATVSGQGFSVASSSCENAALQQGQTCAVQVRFAPTNVGPHSGQLTFNPGKITLINLPIIGSIDIATRFVDGTTVPLSGNGIFIDRQSPSVTSFSPTGKKVSPKANATATFNEDMNEGSVEARGVFTLKKKGSTKPVAAVVSYDAGTDKVTLNPNKSLTRGAVYTAKVTTGARDLAGNALAAQKTWKFTVKK